MKRAYGQAAPSQCYRKGAERVYQTAVASQCLRIRTVDQRRNAGKRNK